MPEIRVVLDGDNAWPDLRKVAEEGKLIEYEGPILLAALEGGMVSGKPSVSFRFDLPDGKVLFAQTSVTLFLQAARILRARFGDI